MIEQLFPKGAKATAFTRLLFASEPPGRLYFQYLAAGGKVCFESRNFTAAFVIDLRRDLTLLFIFTRGQNGATGFRIVAKTVPCIITALFTDI